MFGLYLEPISIEEIEKKVKEAGHPLEFYYYLYSNDDEEKILHKSLFSDNLEAYYSLKGKNIFFEEQVMIGATKKFMKFFETISKKVDNFRTYQKTDEGSTNVFFEFDFTRRHTIYFDQKNVLETVATDGYIPISTCGGDSALESTEFLFLFIIAAKSLNKSLYPIIDLYSKDPKLNVFINDTIDYILA